MLFVNAEIKQIEKSIVLYYTSPRLRMIEFG